jgi:hypothetical protein
MRPDLLHVFTVRANPLRWAQPERHYQEFAERMLAQGVKLHVVECAYGERPFVCELPGVDHIGVRATTMIWNKENLLNIGIRRVPEAEYICWCDSDIVFRRPDWASETVHALQLWDVVQPWTHAYDLGPNDQHMETHTSFCSVLHDGGPLVADGPTNFWKYVGGPYVYPHSGYVWAARRGAIDRVGGLFDVGGMGSGDHHMALAMVGKADRSVPGGVHESYRRHVMRWQERALTHINGRVGYVAGTIEHRFHGSKPKRNYIGRWDMFVKHQFDPNEDLKLNAYGVYELAGNKPELALDFARYLASRQEDANIIS